MTDTPETVLLHGWGGSFARTWERLGWVAHLRARGFLPRGPNLLGHGVPAASHDPDAYGALIDEIDARLADCAGAFGIGYSLGAKSLLDMASRRPGRFRALVLVGIGENAFRPLGASKLLADALRRGLPDDARADVKELIAEVLASGNDPLAMAACIERPQEHPLTPERLASVEIPVLVINGSEDRFVLPDDKLLQALPRGQRQMVPGLDHLEIVASPHAMDAAAQFLGRCLGGCPPPAGG